MGYYTTEINEKNETTALYYIRGGDQSKIGQNIFSKNSEIYTW